MLTLLQEQYPELTAAIWQQLQILDQPAIETSLRQAAQQTAEISTKPETHLAYELEMVKVVLAYQEAIVSFIFGDQKQPLEFGAVQITPEQLIHWLVIIIMLSDIGKAGSHHLEPGHSSPILEIYTHVIMSPDRHGQWLKTQASDQLPAELAVSLSWLKQRPEVYHQVFGAGNFALAPVRLALYCAQEVFRQDFPDHPEYLPFFAASPELAAYLAELELDLDQTAMKDFWTTAHLRSGQQLMKELPLSVEMRAVSQLAFLHHYSQGVHPRLENDQQLNDPRLWRLIALTEVLDKLDANIHRSFQTDAEGTTTITENAVLPGLHRLPKSDQQPTTIQAYQAVFAFIRQTQLTQALLSIHHSIQE